MATRPLAKPFYGKEEKGHCAAGNKCIAINADDRTRNIRCMSCNRFWHLRCRVDGAALWNDRFDMSFTWSCSRTSCRTALEGMRAAMAAEPVVVDSTDSDSDEIQITSVSGPSRSAETSRPSNERRIGALTTPSGPSRVDVDDDLYGPTLDKSQLKAQARASASHPTQSLGSQSSKATTFQPYARPTQLAYASISTRESSTDTVQSDPKARTIWPQAGPSTLRSRIKASRKTPHIEGNRPEERSPPSRKRPRTQSPELAADAIPGFLGKDAPPHFISSDSGDDAGLPKPRSRGEVSSYRTDGSVMPSIDGAQDTLSGEAVLPMPVEPSSAALSGSRPPPLSHREAPAAHHPIPQYTRPPRSPSPRRPRPHKQRSFHDFHDIYPHPSPRVPSPPSGFNGAPIPSPPPMTRDRSPTPLDPSVKAGMIRSHLDDLRARGRLGSTQPPSMPAAIVQPDEDVHMDDETVDLRRSPTSPASARRTTQASRRGTLTSNRTQGYRTAGEDEFSSSDGELGAWARHLNDRERSPGGAIRLKDRYTENTGPQRGAGRFVQRARARGGRGNLFLPYSRGRGRGTSPGRATGTRGTISSQTARGRGRHIPPAQGPVAGGSRTTPPNGDLADDEDEDEGHARAPPKARPRPVKSRPMTRAAESDSDADDMQLDEPAPTLDDDIPRTPRSSSGSPLFGGSSDEEDDEQPSVLPEGFANASRRTVSSTFSALTLNDTPQRTTGLSAKRMSAVYPPPTPSYKRTSRRRSPLRTRTIAELRQMNLLPTYPDLIPDNAPPYLKDGPDIDEEFLPSIVRMNDRIQRWKDFDAMGLRKEERRLKEEEQRQAREERRREKEMRRWERAI